MYALDFEYDGQWLSDYGFMICSFDSSSGVNTSDAGSKITFNKVSRDGGKKYGIAGTTYEDCLQATFDICKIPDRNIDLKITGDEYRDLVRWLNRKEFKRLRIINTESFADSCYFDASFSVSKIFVADILYGLRLEMETNRPFGYGSEIKIEINTNNPSANYIFDDLSDEIGETYPKVVITCKASGDLTLTNVTVGETMVIKNCSNGEIITLSGDTQIITTSVSSHNIANDFNFNFFKMANSFESRINKIQSSLACNIKIYYTPIIKETF